MGIELVQWLEDPVLALQPIHMRRFWEDLIQANMQRTGFSFLLRLEKRGLTPCKLNNGRSHLVAPE